MRVKKTNTPQNDSGKKSPRSFHVLGIVAIIVLLLLFFLWNQNFFRPQADEPDAPPQINGTEKTLQEPPPPLKTEATSGVEDAIQITDSSLSRSTDAIESPEDLTTTQPSALISSDLAPGAENDTTLATQQPNFDLEKGNQTTTLEACSVSSEIIRRFYHHLDQQEYIKAYNLEEPSEKHFKLLIQRLVDNPPTVSGETNDLFTILQNTAHFFRVIGKTNIMLIKGILDQEKDDFENVLRHFYTVINTPTCSTESFDLRIPENSLYTYAGFFLNTMGGRLYLFRRDSMSRMVVNFYSILLIDHANMTANNRDGIEIKTAIDRLISDIETNSNQLKLEDYYLDNLYSLKERYQ